MTLDQLRSFLVVAKHLSFGQAAMELHLTQSAISKQLGALQRELDAKLFARNGGGVELTDAGRSALNKIAPILSQVDDFQESFRRKSPPEPRPVFLSVAASFDVVTVDLPPIIARVEKFDANLVVNCHTGTSQQIQQLLRAGRVELGLSTYRSLTADIACEPFRVRPMVFFISRRHPLAKRHQVTLAEVLAYPLVIRGTMGGPTWTQDIFGELSRRGFKYKVALQCNGPLQVKESVANNIGVGFSYLDYLKGDVASGRMVVLKCADFQFNGLSYIGFSKNRELSPAAQEFLRLLRQAKRIPESKNLDEITGVTKQRGKSFVKR